MIRSKQLPAFEKEFKRLHKRYRSLAKDLTTFESVIVSYPTGLGANFTILHRDERVVIVKARLACAALRERSLRIIYAYHDDVVEFVYIELYFKGDKANEDRERISDYLSGIDNQGI